MASTAIHYFLKILKGSLVLPARWLAVWARKLVSNRKTLRFFQPVENCGIGWPRASPVGRVSEKHLWAANSKRLCLLWL